MKEETKRFIREKVNEIRTGRELLGWLRGFLMYDGDPKIAVYAKKVVRNKLKEAGYGLR